MISTTQLLVFLIPGSIGFFILLFIVPFCGNLPNLAFPLLGRIPLTLCLAMTLIAFMGWGLIVAGGFAIATGTFPMGDAMRSMALLAIALSLYTSIVFSKLLVRRFHDTSSETAEERFIGLSGTVVSTRVPRFSEGRVGQLNITDKTGISGVAAVIPDWAEETPQANDSVQIISFDEERKVYVVIQSESNDYLRWISCQVPPGKRPVNAPYPNPQEE